MAGDSRTFEIGGADQVSYAEIMREYARQRGLRRWMISVPVLTPHLSSLWLGLVTPIYARVGRKLVDGLRYPTVVRDASAAQAFSIRPRGLREAIEGACATKTASLPKPAGRTRFHPRARCARLGRRAAGQPDRRFAHGAGRASRPSWLSLPSGGSAERRAGTAANCLWRLRGFLDLLVGGVGLRRGRRDPETLEAGDVLDFWRVEEFRAGPQPAPGGGNEAAGPGLAGICGDGRCRRFHHPPDCPV